MRTPRRALPAVILAALLLPYRASAIDFEGGLGVGYDSNADRAVVSPRSDGCLAAFGSVARKAGGSAPFDWHAAATLDGTAWSRLSEQDALTLDVSAGADWIPSRAWAFALSPFAQYRDARDSDQSATAWGGRFDAKLRFANDTYVGAHYKWTDSRARADVFSYTEHAAGLIAGTAVGENGYLEAGYAWSRGDAYLSVPYETTATTAATPAGYGGGAGFGGYGYGGSAGAGSTGVAPVYSSSFGALIVRDRVTTHTGTLSAGIDWTTALSTHAGYVGKRSEGATGVVVSHAAFLNAVCRY